MSDLGRILILTAAILAVVGIALLFADRVPWLGRLPGDFAFKRGRTTVYFPLATSIILSIVLTLLLRLLRRGG